MLIPTDLLPSSLGIAWGMTRDQCLDRLNGPMVRFTSEQILLQLAIREETYDVTLDFNGFRTDSGFERLTVYLYQSRDFWEPGENDEEERASIDAEYQGHYDRLIAGYTTMLGPPTYTGIWDWDEEDYPEGETEGQLTYWTRPEGRIQLLYTQQDQELPYEIRLDCYLA